MNSEGVEPAGQTLRTAVCLESDRSLRTVETLDDNDNSLSLVEAPGLLFITASCPSSSGLIETRAAIRTCVLADMRLIRSTQVCVMQSVPG